jgi:hypothetical protein
VSTRPRSKPPAPPAAAQPKRDWRIAVLLGLVLGQAGYLYTRQGKRLAVSLLLGVLALALSLAAGYNEMPPLDFDMLADPDGLQTYVQKATAAMGLPAAVSVLNNIACAIDLYFQVKQGA